jgi:FemAB-related protein (PEP-CTERM system-associated)
MTALEAMVDDVASVASSTSVATASEADAREWDAFVLSSRGATGYHLWAWRRVFERAFAHEAIYLLARENNRVVGVLPLVFIKSAVFGRTLTSLPFLNYGGVVADADGVARALVDAAGAIALERRCRHVELRHVERRFADLPFRQHKVAMLLELEPGLWDGLDRKVRNQVRKAQKSGLTVEHGGAELATDFYTVFARNMRDLGTPVYSRRLFDEVLATFPDRARLHVVRLQGLPVAAGLTYQSGAGTVEIPWASSIREYNSLCPNHLLYWSVIETAAEGGHHVFDFGRSTPGEGTYKFKEQWGARPVQLHWEYYLVGGNALPNVSPANSKFHMAIELWKRLPLGLATRFGPAVVRCIP